MKAFYGLGPSVPEGLLDSNNLFVLGKTTTSWLRMNYTSFPEMSFRLPSFVRLEFGQYRVRLLTDWL